jgi:hypothetical protein
MVVMKGKSFNHKIKKTSVLRNNGITTMEEIKNDSLI